MPDYRVYFFNEHGHIDRMQEFVMDNDLVAIGFVEGFQVSAARELWRGERRVWHWEAAHMNGAAIPNKNLL